MMHAMSSTVLTGRAAPRENLPAMIALVTMAPRLCREAQTRRG